MPFSIRLTKDIEARLVRLATMTKRPKSFFVNEALKQGRSIDILEQIYLTEKAAEEKRAQRIDNEMMKESNLNKSQLALI